MKLVKYLRRVVVLGGGQLGSWLAAQLANVGVEVWLYDLPGGGDDPLEPVRQQIARLAEESPTALAIPCRAGLIHPAGLGSDLEHLRRCDLVIEAVAEDLDIKTGLYVRITPFLSRDAIFVTTTTSLSVNTLAQVLPEVLRWRFCGLHLLLPSHNVNLVELVASELTDPRVLDCLETFVVRDLGKQVVRVKDQPYHVVARFSLLSTLLACHHGDALRLAADQVDMLSGAVLGGAAQGSFELIDQLGSDALLAWLDNARQCLPEDPWLAQLEFPAWLLELTGQCHSVYRRENAKREVWDHYLRAYRPVSHTLPAALCTALAIDEPAQRWAAIRAEQDPQAKFLWRLQRDLYHYAAHWLGDIADCARDVDLALRWGLGWQEGLLETWQRSGWRRVSEWLRSDIRGHLSLVHEPLPAWVGQVQTVHGQQGSLAPLEQRPRPRSSLSVYRHQLLPDRLHGESFPSLGKVLWHQREVCLVDSGDGIGIIDLSAAPATLDSQLVETLCEALWQGECYCRALVLWRGNGVFCLGANGSELLALLDREDHAALSAIQTRWRECLNTLRAMPLPVVAAVHGDCQCLGTELLLYCDRVVASLQSRFSLVGAIPGLPSGAGGLSALARRAYRQAGVEGFAVVLRSWHWLATSGVARNALVAREVGLLREVDEVVMNPLEVLYVARHQALTLAECAYRSPLDYPLPVPGQEGLAVLREYLDRWCAGGELGNHLLPTAVAMAGVLAGGEVAPRTLLDESEHRQLEANLWPQALQLRGLREQLAAFQDTLH